MLSSDVKDSGLHSFSKKYVENLSNKKSEIAINAVIGSFNTIEDLRRNLQDVNVFKIVILKDVVSTIVSIYDPLRDFIMNCLSAVLGTSLKKEKLTIDTVNRFAQKLKLVMEKLGIL